MDKPKDSVKIVSECRREIAVKIPTKKVNEQIAVVVERFRSRAKVKGFRPGLAPQEIVKRMYYEDIKEAVINDLAPAAVSGEIRKLNLIPASSPFVTDISFEEGKPLNLKAQFDIWPEFKLPEYKKIKVKKISESVSAKDVNQSLESLRERAVQYLPVEDRGVTAEDYVMVEIKGKDRKTKKMLPTEKTYVLASHEDNEKALNDNLLGMKPNAEKEFSIEYKKDHKNKRVAGKLIDYHLKVTSIKEKKLPELDDNFAKEIGKFDTLKELKSAIKKELVTARKQESDRALSEEVMQQIAEKTKLVLPESVVTQETMENLKQFMSSQPQQKFTAEDMDKLKEEAGKRAERNLKNHLILSRIAEAEKLEISEADITEELKTIAQANNVPLPRVMESVNKDGKKEELKQNLLMKKTIDFLTKNAIIE